MAEYRLPHEVYYETREPISISDVIESLLGTEAILKDMGPLLEACIPGASIERIEISVKEIAEGTLKEVVWTAIFLTFQTDLEKDGNCSPPLGRDQTGWMMATPARAARMAARAVRPYRRPVAITLAAAA